MKLSMLLLLALLVAVPVFAQAATPGNALAWTWTQGSGISGTGFNVYGSNVAGGPYSKLTTTLIPITTFSYLDTTAIVEGRLYCYVVTAMGVFNGAPAESANSAETCVTRSTKPAIPGKPTVTPQ